MAKGVAAASVKHISAKRTAWVTRRNLLLSHDQEHLPVVRGRNLLLHLLHHHRGYQPLEPLTMKQMPKSSARLKKKAASLSPETGVAGRRLRHEWRDTACVYIRHT